MRARSTRLAGSVRDRDVVSKRARSSGENENSMTRRGAAMIFSRVANDLQHYNPRRDHGNPYEPAGSLESMY